jgi:hypothetical protein
MLGGAAPDTEAINTGRMLVQELPLDERSFDDICTVDLKLFVSHLTECCLSYSAEPPVYVRMLRRSAASEASRCAVQDRRPAGASPPGRRGGAARCC